VEMLVAMGFDQQAACEVGGIGKCIVSCC
jgi:hypothetical protein